jgi:hypothetical protein
MTKSKHQIGTSGTISTPALRHMATTGEFSQTALAKRDNFYANGSAHSQPIDETISSCSENSDILIPTERDSARQLHLEAKKYFISHHANNQML